jgi:hypothetical protein
MFLAPCGVDLEQYFILWNGVSGDKLLVQDAEPNVSRIGETSYSLLAVKRQKRNGLQFGL